MGPPYVNPRFDYSHLSINVAASGQMILISQSDAKWRLAGPRTDSPPFPTSTNQEALDKIKGRPKSSIARPAAARTATTTSAASAANRAAIDRIRLATRPAHTTSPAGITLVRRAPNIAKPTKAASSNQQVRRYPASQALRKKGVVQKILTWLFG